MKKTHTHTDVKIHTDILKHHKKLIILTISL